MATLKITLTALLVVLAATSALGATGRRSLADYYYYYDYGGRRSLAQETGEGSADDVPGIGSGTRKEVDVDAPKFDVAFHRSLAQDMPEDALCDMSIEELTDTGMTAGEIINTLQNCPPSTDRGTPAVTTPAYPPVYAPPVTGPAYPPVYAPPVTTPAYPPAYP
ncbi:hypothetical protein FOA52_006223 [Chlamydomonas sp. UWO 241]|nr:hypothetical protein FOA52_006223 [Chlamydomonas sp. UWO 241]